VIKGLREGRSDARETAPIRPVSEADVQTVMPQLSGVLQAMIRFMQLTGCRPTEACLLRPQDVDQTGEIWLYRPMTHKTEHHGRERCVFIGPRAQVVLQPFLNRAAETFCFSPKESISPERLRRRRACSQKAKAQRPRASRRRERYSKDSFARAIARACQRAGIPSWSPNQLRHASATAIRKQFGLEAAQVVLGHARADVTQIYAEKNLQLAREIALKMG